MSASVGMRSLIHKLMALCVPGCGLFALVFAANVVSATKAHAEYDLCNETSYVIRAAIAYKGDSDYQSAGWFIVYPGFCRPVIDKPLNQGTYYIHGRTIISNTGAPMHDWAGDEQFCVADNDFEISGSSECEKRGYGDAYFNAVEVGHAKNWTTTFTEPNQLDLPKAQILGTQRLLVDLGLLPRDQMDGYLGRSTVNAIERFKRQNSIEVPEQPSVELMRALVQNSQEQAKNHGLQLCNSTKYAVWAAVGVPIDAATVNTKGWFEIQPSACVKPAIEPLSKDYVYVYGETVDAAEKKLYWRGDNRLCTNDVSFSISTKPDSCDDQGLIPLDFAKVGTGGKSFLSFSFTEDKSSDHPGS
ncbi:MAG: DUF1036 domain-containing protein [Alphaproteobacteria bacterium]